MSLLSGVMGGSKVRKLKDAILAGDAETVKQLVTDVDLDLAHYFHDEPTQSTALILATRKNCLPVVRILAAHDTERHINLKDKYWGKTALMFACENGYASVVKVLLEKGAMVKYPKQNTGCTALILAAKYGQVDIVKLLIPKSDINATNGCGFTALMATVIEGKATAVFVVQALLDANANVNLQDKEEWTAIMHAVHKSRTEIISLLVKHGANVDIKNKRGQTTWTIAKEHSNPHLYDLLEGSHHEHFESVRRESIHRLQETRNQCLQQAHDLIAQRMLDTLTMDELVHIPIEYIIHCTDDFSLSNRLGQGRFGEVFKAKDGDQVFVVKLLNDDGMKSFRTEKEVLQRIRHKSIVRLFGTSTYGRHDILILEYLSEGALSRHLSDDDKRKRLYPSVRIKIMYKIALALHCLRNESEKYQLYHGDLKSANICLDGNYSPKLIDWGLTKIKVIEGREQFLSIAPTFFNNHNDGAGTFGYMCPKYKQNLIPEYEGACDVYSFGVVMFELITGRLVAEGDLVHMYKTAEKLSQGADRIFADAWSGALFDLCKLALSCVEYELTDRPSLEDVILKLSCIRSRFKVSRRDKWKSILRQIIQKARIGEDNIDTLEPQATQDELPGMNLIHAQSLEACACAISSPLEMNGNGSNRSVDLEMIDEMRAIKQRLELLEGSARDAEIQKLTNKLENLEKEAEEAREFRRTVWKILTVVVTENNPCPRFVVVKPLSVDSSNWSFQRLLNNEASVYFICECSYESVEAFKVKITHEWVKKVAPVLQITWEVLKKGTGFMIPFGDILGGVADALVKMTMSLLHGGCPTFDPSSLIELATGTSSTDPDTGSSVRQDMYEVTKGYYSSFAEIALLPENSGWRSKMCAVPSSEGGHKWVKNEYSQIMS